MAKYTVEFGEMVNAHANIVDAVKEDEKLSLSNPYTNEKLIIAMTELTVKDPNNIIDDYARSFFDKHVRYNVKSLKVTDNDAINDEIYSQFCRAFCRQFYYNEIGQENPLGFLVLLRNFLEKHLPIFAQAYQKLFIENLQWITNVSDSETKSNSDSKTTSDSTNSSVAGTADTPQDELNFKINTGDPTDDYNFNYSSQVNGAKGKANTVGTGTNTADSTTHSEGRNAIITDLINGMLQYTDGIYFDLFTKAKNDGLFLFVY